MATPLRRHPKDRIPTSRISSRHPDGPGQRQLLRSPNTKRDSLGRPDVDRGKGPENQRSLYRGKSSPKLVRNRSEPNMYFGKDPTQRRNCHYLVLFKNPIDRQPIATLGRQMYPGRAHDSSRWQYFIPHKQVGIKRTKIRNGEYWVGEEWFKAWTITKIQIKFFLFTICCTQIHL